MTSSGTPEPAHTSAKEPLTKYEKELQAMLNPHDRINKTATLMVTHPKENDTKDTDQ